MPADGGATSEGGAGNATDGGAPAGGSGGMDGASGEGSGQGGAAGAGGVDGQAGSGAAVGAGGEAGHGGASGDGGADGGGAGGAFGSAGFAGDVAMAGAGGSASLGPAPIGLITFFDTSACPSGWEEALAARGRMIVSTVTGAEVGQTSGAPLGDREDREHMHPWSGNALVGSVAVVTTVGGNTTPGASGGILLAGPTELSSSLLPFTQLLGCRLAQDLGEGDVFPQNTPDSSAPPVDTLSYVAAETCPDDWERPTTMEGRFLVGAPDGGLLGANFGGPSLAMANSASTFIPSSATRMFPPRAWRQQPAPGRRWERAGRRRSTATALALPSSRCASSYATAGSSENVHNQRP